MIRLDELYQSIQGEGPRVGERTIFVRFAGCNLRCPGWPCDTQHAIDVKFRKEWEHLTIDLVYNRIVDLTGRDTGINICFTGGEPFLQKSEDLRLLTQRLIDDGYLVECFSNGTLPYADWVHENIHLIMDWKLPGSGEYTSWQDTRIENVRRLSGKDAVKFVIKDLPDFLAAVALWKVYLQGGVEANRPQVFYGLVWGAPLGNERLTHMVMQEGLPWRLNVQMHNYIYDRNKRGI